MREPFETELNMKKRKTFLRISSLYLELISPKLSNETDRKKMKPKFSLFTNLRFIWFLKLQNKKKKLYLDKESNIK